MNISNDTIIKTLKWAGTAAGSIVSIAALCTLYWNSNLPRFATNYELDEIIDTQARAEIDYRTNRDYWDKNRLYDLNKKIALAKPEDDARDLLRQKDELDGHIKDNNTRLERAKDRLGR